MIKIEKKIKIPVPMCKEYPFHDMEIGDSFFIALSEKDTVNKLQIKLCARANYYVSRHNKTAKFTSRCVKNGVRIWKIK